MEDNNILQEFWAVTRTSIYHISVGEACRAVATKTAIHHGKSNILANTELAGGGMLAIGKRLVTYTPEGHGWLSPGTSFERCFEKVNTQWWGGSTSEVVALFLSEETALACSREESHMTNDPRWRKETQEVLKRIGPDHPAFYICPKTNTLLGSLLAD